MSMQVRTPLKKINTVSQEVVKRLRSLFDKPTFLHEPFFGGNELAYLKECVDTGWVSSVGKYVDKFEEALKGDSKEAIEAATTKLTEASSGLAQRMYEEQAAAGQAAEGAEQTEGAAQDDDVVDAEFEEVKDSK